MSDETIDATEVAIDLVDTWATLVVPAFRQKYGEQAGRDLQTQTDSLRVTLLDLLEASEEAHG